MDNTVTTVLIIIGIMVAIYIYMFFNNRNQKQTLKAFLRSQFGEPSDREYTLDELECISHYFQRFGEEDTYIDDITWNDLDMDSIFIEMNLTRSSAGQEYLYYLLRKPCISQEELENRKRLMDYFSSKEEERVELQSLICEVGRTRNISITDFIFSLENLKREGNGKHYMGIVAMLASIGILLVEPRVGIMLTVGCLGYNIVSYYKQKAEMEPYLESVKYLLRLLNGVDHICKLKYPELEPYVEELRKAKDEFKKFRKNSRLVVSSSNASLGIEQILLDYVRMIFHVDIIKFNSMLAHFQGKTKAVKTILDNVGYLDAMISVSSYREGLLYYAVPDLNQGEKKGMIVEELYHPLLQNPVANSLNETSGVLLTGSNASGKSTFLKTVAVNALVSQTLNFSYAKSYQAPVYRIYSSMALKDNLQGNESYYIVEIKSLKRILDAMKTEEPLLCFVDEVLRGTNTLERVAASTEILKSLCKPHVMCFAATHDIELTFLLENYYQNYHFQEEVQDNDIIFDYQLYQGRATSRNAIKLLSIMGYDQEIIQRAYQLAEGGYVSVGVDQGGLK